MASSAAAALPGDATTYERHRFCVAHGLASSTFDLWRRKLRVAPTVREEDPEALFVELSEPAVAQTRGSTWEVLRL